jgi:hypothetical protein
VSGGVSREFWEQRAKAIQWRCPPYQMLVIYGAKRSYTVHVQVDAPLEGAVRAFISSGVLPSFAVVRPGDLLLIDPDGPSTNWSSSTVDQWSDTLRSKLYSGARMMYAYKRLIVRFRDPRMEVAHGLEHT